MARRRLEIEIAADTTKLNRGLANANRSLTSFGKGVTSKGGRGGILDSLFLTKGNVAFAAGAAGTAALTKGLSSVIRAAKDAEEAQAGLRQALNATGISWTKNQQAIDKAIQSTSKIAGIDDEEVSRSFANLVRTTGSVSKATRDVALAANIARARHISLAAATKILEKAEIGQFRGLKTIGIQLGKNVTSTEAITAAQKKFAGSSEAFGRTAAGSQAKLGVAFENLQERIGVLLLPLLTRVSLALVDLIDSAERNWPRFAKAVSSAYQKIRPLIQAIQATIKGVGNVLVGTVKIIEGIAHGDWSRVWDGLKQVAIQGIGAIVVEMVKLPARILAALGRSAFRGLERVGGYIKDAVVAGLKGLEHAVIAAITGAIDKAIAVINKVIAAANKISGAVSKIPGVHVGKIPNVPTFGQAGQGAAGPRVAPPGLQPPGAPGGVFGAGPGTTTIIVPVSLDGQVLARVVTSHQNRSSRHNAGSFGGRTPGLNPGTA